MIKNISGTEYDLSEITRISNIYGQPENKYYYDVYFKHDTRQGVLNKVLNRDELIRLWKQTKYGYVEVTDNLNGLRHLSDSNKNIKLSETSKNTAILIIDGMEFTQQGSYDEIKENIYE